ncbi:hypothetical protein QO002_002933 [Pararhizobium capsulatum DSM 1112]|uniref:Uncharacterized protein n=1 Tax=Pararhizobium capsulatum DSM 1112 TaxID=1121113 RepID=A0ABU0BTK9_9HYPH|nr:hypothetical protein [Pararhizobium capsulatum]MDQ0320795.1 hypothetical protein [Pararhizobium capsulatum DSM 1112]
MEKDGGNYILTLPDNYQIGLSSVTATSMEWMSMASGDMFHCTKAKP